MDNAQQIIAYLEELAQVLVNLGVTSQFHMLVPGGAYMLLQNRRRSTEDIDFALIASPHDQVGSSEVFRAVVQRSEVSRRESLVPFAQEFKEAVSIIAQRHRLPVDWLNDESAVYLYDDAPQAEVFFWRAFREVLFIYLPTAEYVLALKIAAWRPKDENDIQMLLSELHIENREQAQAIVSTFLLPDAQAFWEVDDHLDILFPE